MNPVVKIKEYKEPVMSQSKFEFESKSRLEHLFDILAKPAGAKEKDDECRPFVRCFVVKRMNLNGTCLLIIHGCFFGSILLLNVDS